MGDFKANMNGVHLDNDLLSVASSDDVGESGDLGCIDGKDAERASLAQRENAVVTWMKGVVFVVLVATAIAVSTGLYLYTRNDQRRDFEHSYRADAAKLVESFQVTVKRTLESIDAVSVTITSHAKETNATFPNVTLPDFEVRYANTRILSGSVYVEYLPLVSDKDRLGWEAYQIENRAHFHEAFKSDEVLRHHQDAQYNNSLTRRNLKVWSEVNDKIVNMGADETLSPAPVGAGPYLPLWQISPVPPSTTLLNFNAFSHPSFGGAYKETVDTGKAVMNVASNLALGDTSFVFKMLLVISQYRFDVEEYLGDPISNFGYPVFDSFDLDNRKVVGVVGASFYWRLYLKDVLPPDTKGIMCVLENTQGQMFTYRIDDTVTYLGNGDLHDKRYDYLEVSSDVGAYISQILSPQTKSYTSVDLNTEYCNYKLRVYPSSDTESEYINHDPAIISAVIVSVFLFTSLVFVLYTIAVATRQKVVMNRAVASSAIVSSLFPEQVRDKIYQENETDNKKTWHTSDTIAESIGSELLNSSKPIAELYQNTTVMFADLVGFTSWSSSRNPVEVFELLETLYQAFDVIAMARKVFKVETIGDCYVAVAGLPKPQNNHAVIMCRFAYDCLQKMREVIAELSHTLGSDTDNLAMRIGLHSGSVTGGVLRGQKSRFQLFGDTMNLASRMESNGEAGKIHVSEETARELTDKGKGNWLTPREGKIIAKGKGEMQTYWVCPRVTAQSRDGSMLSGSAGSSAVSSYGEDEHGLLHL